MAATVLPIEMIVSDPDKRRGQPVIAGTRIAVSDLVVFHTGEDQLTPEQLAYNFFNLSMGQVHAALAYYHEHKPEIEAAIQENDEAIQQITEELKAQGKLISA